MVNYLREEGEGGLLVGDGSGDGDELALLDLFFEGDGFFQGGEGAAATVAAAAGGGDHGGSVGGGGNAENRGPETNPNRS